MATPPSPNDLTRQQLDELDALLQRMLSLPLNKPEAQVAPAFPPLPLPEISAPAPAASPKPSYGWRMDSAPPTTKLPYSQTPPLPAPPSAVAFTPAFTPISSTPTIRDTQPNPSHEPRAFFHTEPTPAVEYMPHTGTLRGVDAPATPVGFRSAFAPPETVEEPMLPSPTLELELPTLELAPALVTAGKRNQPRTPLVLMPLALMNGILETCFRWLGPIGEWMTKPAVKTMLGWTGIALIASAGYWAAKSTGLLSLPH